MALNSIILTENFCYPFQHLMNGREIYRMFRKSGTPVLILR